MANETNKKDEHEKIFNLLPWYVNHTLESDQSVSVSQHVAQCSECQSEVEFLNTVNKTVQDDAVSHQPGHGDVDTNLASVISRIDSEANQTNPTASLPSILKETLEKLFSFPAALTHAQWGATAIAGLLVAVLGFQWYSGESADQYSVLSSTDNDGTFIRLLLEADAATDIDQIQALVRSTFKGVGEPTIMQTETDDDYVLTLKESIGVVELNEMISNLQGEAQIESVKLMP